MATSNNSISGINNNSIDMEYNKIFKHCIENECKSCDGKNEECEECYEKEKCLNSKKNIEYILNNIHINENGFLDVTNIINLINEIFLEYYECFIYDECTYLEEYIWEKRFLNKDYIFLYKYIHGNFNLFFIDKKTGKVKEIYKSYGYACVYFHLKLNDDFENYINNDDSDNSDDDSDDDCFYSDTGDFFYHLLEFFQTDVLKKFDLFNKYKKNLLQKLRIISYTIENTKKNLVNDTINTIISYLYKDSDKLLNILNDDCKILNNIELDVLTLTKNETNKLFNDVDELYKTNV